MTAESWVRLIEEMIDLKLQHFAQSTAKLSPEISRFLQDNVRPIGGEWTKSASEWFGRFKEDAEPILCGAFPTVSGAMMLSAERAAFSHIVIRIFCPQPQSMRE